MLGSYKPHLARYRNHLTENSQECQASHRLNIVAPKVGLISRTTLPVDTTASKELDGARHT
jgi:hypothetical protein